MDSERNMAIQRVESYPSRFGRGSKFEFDIDIPMPAVSTGMGTPGTTTFCDLQFGHFGDGTSTNMCPTENASKSCMRTPPNSEDMSVDDTYNGITIGMKITADDVKEISEEVP